MTNWAAYCSPHILYHSTLSDKLNSPTYFMLLIAALVELIIMLTHLSSSHNTWLIHEGKERSYDNTRNWDWGSNDILATILACIVLLTTLVQKKYPWIPQKKTRKKKKKFKLTTCTQHWYRKKSLNTHQHSCNSSTGLRSSVLLIRSNVNIVSF